MEARDYKLVLLGGARNEEDYQRVEKLKQTVENLDLKANVVFEVNVCVLFNFYHFFRPVMKHYIIICPLQRLVCILCIRNILAFLL